MSGQTENPQNLGDLTEEQLDGLLEQAPQDNREGDGDFADGNLEFMSEEEAEADAEAETDEEQGEEDSTKEAAPTEEAESEEETEEEEDASTDVQTQMEAVLQRLEIMEAERERLTSELERERLLRDRNAGKLGALMQQLDRRQDQKASGDDEDEGLEDDATERRPSKAKDPRDEELREIRAERVQTAISGVSQEFLEENQAFFSTLQKEAGDKAAQKFHTDLVAKIRSTQDQLGEDIFSMNPKLAAKVARTVIRSAFADVKLDLMREYQKRAAEKSEESRRTVRARKKGAAGVRSVKRAAAKAPKTKSLSQMSEAELDAVLAESSFDD